MKAISAVGDPQLAKVLNDVPFPKDVAERISVYRKYSARFQKFHDSGELSSKDVTDVLREAGVLGPGTRPGVPVPSTGGKPAPRPNPNVHQAPPPTENYAGAYRWPTDAGVVSSEYGARWGKSHDGVDVAAHVGEPVKAAAAGVVLYAGDGLRGYGNVLIVRHDSKVTTLYGHNSKLLARKGQNVAAGETIALLGNTGRSTGPHVHFEFREGEHAVNPRTKLGKAPYALRFENGDDASDGPELAGLPAKARTLEAVARSATARIAAAETAPARVR